MNSLKRFLTPMLSDHQTRPFPKAALVLIHIQENPNLKGKSDESDAILDHSSSLTYSVSEKKS